MVTVCIDDAITILVLMRRRNESIHRWRIRNHPPGRTNDWNNHPREIGHGKTIGATTTADVCHQDRDIKHPEPNNFRGGGGGGGGWIFFRG